MKYFFFKNKVSFRDEKTNFKQVELDIRRNIRFSIKTASTFILIFSIQRTLHHLSVLDIQYKMFTLVFTGVHAIKLNQARPSSRHFRAKIDCDVVK